MAVTEQNFSSLFREQMRKEINAINDEIMDRCPDYPTYVGCVERVNGILVALRILDDLEARFFGEHEQDDDEEPVKF